MKITLAISIVLLATAVSVHGKPQSFFPDADDTFDGQDNLKMESVGAPTLAFPNEGDGDRDIPASPQAPELDSESLRAIDTIVTATREGRRLQFNDSRLDELVSDPNVKEKLASASEVEARGFIRDKLCSIGLCDEGGFGHPGHGHHGGLSAAAKHVQLVQPVALKPIGHPIAAIPLEKGKHSHGFGGHGHGSSGSYGVPPPPPPFGHHGGGGGGGFGFGGASGGFINTKPGHGHGHGGPPIFPQHDPDAEFIPRPGLGPAQFKPNYGGYPQRPLPPQALPITKPLNTHIHHHIHHHEPNPALNGHGPVAPYLDGYYGAGAKSSVSVATPSGKALGMYPKDCVCVPAEQCYNYNGIDQAGNQPAQIVHGLSTGIPNNGFVGYGIDPRNLKAGQGQGIESNATEVELESTATSNSESESDIPDSPASRTRRETGGFEGGVLKSDADGESEPRQLNYNGAPRNCQPGFVCCQMGPQHPLASVQTPNTLVGYVDGSGRQQQPFGLGQCGKRQTEGINGRVISGTKGHSAGGFGVADGDTNFGDYPWHVAILKNAEFVCSGSLIDSYNILTAAHCIKRLVPAQLKVRLGEWDVNHETEFYPFVELQVESIAVHPDFYAGNLVNDVAILRLSSPIEFPRHPHISPVCLPPPNIDFAGRRCFVSGWGKDAFGAQGKFQNALKEVDLPVLTHFDCEQKLKRTRLGRDFTLDKGFVCAGGESNKDACKGDGGGGLVCDVQGTWYLAGIVSWGVGCGEVDVPGVYAKISEYTPWIQKNTGIHH